MVAMGGQTCLLAHTLPRHASRRQPGILPDTATFEERAVRDASP